MSKKRIFIIVLFLLFISRFSFANVGMNIYSKKEEVSSRFLQENNYNKIMDNLDKIFNDKRNKLFAPSTEEKKYIKAVNKVKKEIEKDPKNSELYSILAFFYYHLGYYEKSLEAFKNSLKYYPEERDEKDKIYGNLARVYLILNRFKKAKEALDKAMKINSENVINNIHLANYYLKKDDVRNTAKTLKKLDDLDREGYHYHSFLTRGLFDLNIDPIKMIAVFRKLTEIDPDNYRSYKTYAESLRYEFDHIIKNFHIIKKNHKKAIELASKNIYNYISFGNSYVFRGLAADKNSSDYFKTALSWIKKAKELAPNSPKVAFSLGNCYLYLKDYDKAIEKLEYALEKKVQMEYTRKLLASAYNDKAYKFYKQGKNIRKGIRIIDKAISLNPDCGVCLATKAELLYKLEKYKSAYTYIKQAIALNPDHPEIQKDLEMIKDALGKEGRN